MPVLSGSAMWDGAVMEKNQNGPLHAERKSLEGWNGASTASSKLGTKRELLGKKGTCYRASTEKSA